MAKFRCLIVLGIHVLSLFVSAAAQQGFLNINCGATKNETDSQTNMTWIPDSSKYINVGQTANVNNPSIASYLQSLRFFPKPIQKSCYQLPVIPNVPCLLRLWFVFGNYNGIKIVPSFNVSVEAQGMLQIEPFQGVGVSNWTTEKILVSSGKVLCVCLIRTSQDSDPFISAIELRSLSSGMYAEQVKAGKMLSSVFRYDLGSNKSLIRYPSDEFDRFWRSDSPLSLYNTSLVENKTSDKIVSSDNSSSNFPPNTVMQTAIIAKKQVTQLRLNLGEPKARTLVALYFGEVETLNASESRVFNVSINGQSIGPINFSTGGKTINQRMTLNDSQARELVLSLDAVKTRANSSRGPLVNALEQYNIIYTEPETLAEDVSSLLNIKSAFGMEEWISDPCFGIEWDGIRCEKGNPVRILEIDLSGRGKTGAMPKLCNLTGLETLRLQNNDLSGEIPECLTTFPKLKELNLDNNNFSGIIPQGLLSNSRLSLRIKGNPLLCQRYRSRCHPKVKNIGAIIGYSLGAILGFLISLISIIIYRRRYSNKRNKANRSTQGNTTSLLSVMIPNLVRSRQFSLVEMKTATQNFTQQIGQGGFGSVYFGCLQDGKEVAVKVLSASSKQGVPEFLNEIDLLSRVNHKNLVSWFGYCNVSRKLMLVYEYMGEGSLKDHLYGSLRDTSPLDWKSRLQIALDAAEGLEYLHVRSTPKIIHRDVKSSNILLDRIMRAKVADFGLSKILSDETVSHVSTNVKGTVGYLDPEYFRTNKLTERSDVFSFGIVLLEIICGRKPVEEELSEEEINIVKWVMIHAEATEDSSRQLTDIIDKSLSMSEDEMESFYILLNLSIECTHNEGSKRPTMSEIVAGIREAMSVICRNKEPTTKPVEPLCSTEISTSIVHAGR